MSKTEQTGKTFTISAAKLLSGDNRIRLLVIAGILGMVLIFLSSYFEKDKNKETPDEFPQSPSAVYTSEQYIEEMEQKLTSLITGIKGVGQARVMVTLEAGVEYVYVQEEKRNTDLTRENGTTEVSGKVYEKENVEQKYILVEGADGKKQPLLKTELQPKIQGVVIVCEGADDILVQNSLINVATTALNIPSTRVCVVQIDKNTLALQEEAE